MILHPAMPTITYAVLSGATLLQTDTDPQSPLAWLSTLGPFSVAIALSYYLLKRSDSREAVADRTHHEREQSLLAELTAARKDAVEARAELTRLKENLE